MTGRRGSSGGAAAPRSQPAVSTTSASRARSDRTGRAATRGLRWRILLSCSELLAQVTLLFMEPTARRPAVSGGEPAVAGRPQRVSALGASAADPRRGPAAARTLNRSGRIWLAAAAAILLVGRAGHQPGHGRPDAAGRPRGGMVRRDTCRVADRRHADRARPFALDVPGAVLVGGGRPGRPAPLPAPVRPARGHPAVTALCGLLAYIFVWPRPLGVEILGDWTGYASPSRPVAALTVILMGALYSLAPAGRLRRLGAGDHRPGHRRGRPAVPGRERAHRRADRRDHRGHHPPGRLPADHPSEVFPVTYHSGSFGSDWTRPPRPGPSTAPSRTSWASRSRRSSCSACLGRPARPRLGQGQGRPRDLAVRQAVRRQPPALGPQRWAGPCCTAGWRTRSRSIPSAAGPGRRTTPWLMVSRGPQP